MTTIIPVPARVGTSLLRSDRRRKTTHGGAFCLPHSSKAASPTLCCSGPRCRSSDDPNLKILQVAREKFVQEISFKIKDKDVSLAK